MKSHISLSNMDQLGFFKDKSKSHDADMQSKSDISTEIGTHHHIITAEDGLNTTTQDSQRRTESSCSNSLSIVFPVSSSNQSYHMNCVGPTDSSNSKTTSSESGVSAQIARKAVINARAKNSMKICSINDGKKVDEEISHEDGEVIAGFDLNEDINANEMDDVIQPVNEINNISSSSRVIHVLAKTGIPRGQPMIPLKFEGGLGWKGSSGNSAFRPANHKMSLSNERQKEPTGFGFDLNVAAEEDNEGVSSEKAKILSFDLNCQYNGDDELSQPFSQPSLQRESRNPTLVDLNKSSDSAYPGKQDFEFTRQDYLAHLSRQNIGNTNNILQPVELMQRVASLQPNFPFMPSYNYSSMGPFHLPYGRYSQEYGTVNASFGTTPYLVQKRDSKTEEQEAAWYAASVKRKEPEGGLEFYQLGYKI